MKKWEKGYKPASFEDIQEHIIKAIEFAYKLERQNEGKDIPYEGYDVGMDTKVSNPEAVYALSAKMIEFNEEDQGRSPLETIITICLQLGIEQGRRINMEKLATKFNLIKGYSRELKSQIDYLGKEFEIGEEE